MDFFNFNFELDQYQSRFLDRVKKVFSHQQFVDGPEVSDLEECLSRRVSDRYALAVSSGTDALLLALMSEGVGPGCEVITTPLTFSATAEVIVRLGATPVFVDIDPKTFLIDVKKFESAITAKTKAVIPVSLHGNIPDMDLIRGIAESKKIFVVEDGAQSFGSTRDGVPSGALSEVGVTSFFPAKALGAFGNGGCLFVKDKERFELIKKMRFHGQSDRNDHVVVGLNARMNTFQAGFLLERLHLFDELLKERAQIAQIYESSFSGKPRLKTPFFENGVKSNWANYVIRVSDRDRLQTRFLENSIPFKVHYPKLLCDQPFLKGRCQISGSLENARQAVDEILSLPLYPGMPSQDIDLVVETVLGGVV